MPPQTASLAPSYPPTTTPSPPTPVPPSAALSHIQTYLHRALTAPSLHPSAHLTERGPTASLTSSTATASNLTLHNLRRLEAGLRGEHLGPEPAPQQQAEGEEEEEEEGKEEAQWEDMDGAQEELEQERKRGVVAAEGVQRPVEVLGGRVLDKAERKRLKKERGRLEKIEKAERRRRESAAERGG
ncbi:hypothetical protein FGG08_003333 [Glutinoglossum americanum]|uniref:Uncharacterized protein n=1 Tax=Glutinoglossum americanum TaxID=1670608 RepID=A0A9P8I7T1_9PEZI|nr:hypothetical protein FGG08_003333 [Glutinoglossum americanum]